MLQGAWRVCRACCGDIGAAVGCTEPATRSIGPAVGAQGLLQVYRGNYGMHRACYRLHRAHCGVHGAVRARWFPNAPFPSHCSLPEAGAGRLPGMGRPWGVLQPCQPHGLKDTLWGRGHAVRQGSHTPWGRLPPGRGRVLPRGSGGPLGLGDPGIVAPGVSCGLSVGRPAIGWAGCEGGTRPRALRGRFHPNELSCRRLNREAACVAAARPSSRGAGLKIPGRQPAGSGSPRSPGSRGQGWGQGQAAPCPRRGCWLCPPPQLMGCPQPPVLGSRVPWGCGGCSGSCSGCACAGLGPLPSPGGTPRCRVAPPR